MTRQQSGIKFYCSPAQADAYRKASGGNLSEWIREALDERIRLDDLVRAGIERINDEGGPGGGSGVHPGSADWGGGSAPDDLPPVEVLEQGWEETPPPSPTTTLTAPDNCPRRSFHRPGVRCKQCGETP